MVALSVLIITILLQQKSFAQFSLGTCSIQCGNQSSIPAKSSQGPRGERGPRGFKGEPGNGCDCANRQPRNGCNCANTS